MSKTKKKKSPCLDLKGSLENRQTGSSMGSQAFYREVQTMAEMVPQVSLSSFFSPGAILLLVTFRISSNRTDLISKSSKLQIYPEVWIGSFKDKSKCYVSYKRPLRNPDLKLYCQNFQLRKNKNVSSVIYPTPKQLTFPCIHTTEFLAGTTFHL